MSNEVQPVAAPAAEPVQAPTDAGQQAVEVQPVEGQQQTAEQVQPAEETINNKAEGSNIEGQTNVQTEPTNMSEALEQVYEMESKRAEKNVSDTQSDTKPEGQNNDNISEQEQPKQEPVRENSQPNQQQNQNIRETSDNTQSFNPDLYQRQIENAAREASMKEAVQEQINAGVRLWNIEDCMKRDEDSGQVYLINPNTGEQVDEFKAQQLVDLHNRWAKDKAQQVANARYNEKMNSLKPAMETQKFINTRYQTMDETTRNVFNEMIEPYAVNNKVGQRVGFNCDLNAYADRAQAIVRQFAPQQQAQVQQSNMFNGNPKAEVSTPAVDAPTGSSDPTGKADQPEPQSLEEALERVYEDKENNNG